MINKPERQTKPVSGRDDFLSCQVEIRGGEANVVDVQLQLLRRGVNLWISATQRA